MKKLFILGMLIFAVMSMSVPSKAQTSHQSGIKYPDSAYLVKYTDEMTGKEYLLTSHNFVIANHMSTEGFEVSAFFTTDFGFRDIYIKAVGVGGCNENDGLIILFENGEKVTLTSWKEFNCDGEAYFSPSFDDLEKLSKYPMSKIRFTNGRSYDSYTGEVPENYKRWFIQILYALNNKLCSITQ